MSRVPHSAWLVLRAQSGDRDAMEELLRHAHGMLHRHVATVAGDPDLAADVMQDALLAIFRKLDTLQEPRAFDAWARRIASRLLFSKLRRKRQYEMTHEPLDADVHDTESAEEHPVDPELTLLLPELIARLSPASREVLVLHYLEDLSIPETALILDLPVGTVKSRLAYGLRTLRQLASDMGILPMRPDMSDGRT